MRQFQKYVGWQFKAGGDSPSGIDCLNLYRIVAKNEFNLDTPDYRGHYHRLGGDFDYRGDLPNFAHANLNKWQEHQVPMVSDAILFRVRGHPLHVGMVIDTKQKLMLHIEEGCDSIIESYDGLIWSKRRLGFYRWVE